ncbi:DUF1572 family protein [Zobellia barbeyronii]|uniref:DUF1572 family protein n=1 Tax=Zobellia barbeyronii TaxID=2748009 RepID=UPI001CECB052|nr:DUF1572 family protein [Zobellia barbeyronii]
MKETLIELFTRDLNTLKNEIALYSDDTTLWKVENSIKNSGGNLCLHIIGNLKTFIGNALALDDYIRRRDFEFSGKNVDRTILYKEIDETISIVTKGISMLSDDQLNGNYPALIWKNETKTDFTLIHLHSHLTYHLGQINYHRRLLEH